MLVFEVIEIEALISFIDLDEFADTIIKLMGVFVVSEGGALRKRPARVFYVGSARSPMR